MANKYTFGLKSKFTDFIKYCNQFSACSVGQKWNKDIQAFFPNIKDMTMQDVADIFLKDPNRDDRWVDWVIRTWGHLGEPKADWIYYIKSIRTPQIALRLYLDIEWLTDEQDEFLISVFKKEMPNAVKEINEGIVKRKKVMVEKRTIS